MTSARLIALSFGVSTAMTLFAYAASEGPLAHRADLSEADRARIAGVTASTGDFTKAEPFEVNQGGATTVERFDRDAFSQFSANLPFEGRSDFAVGNGVFRKLWTPAPSSTTASDGLGPLFNSRGCQNCHLKDGRGQPPRDGAAGAESFVLGLSVPAPEGEPEFPQTVSELVVPEPTYGSQLQDLAAAGHAAEGRVVVTYGERAVQLSGGETASLRVPRYEIAELGYGPLHPDTMISPRVAPQMIGLGLLEFVHEGDILALADPDDEDGDGISGRPNWNVDVSTGEPALGRFGSKAIQPTVRQQAAFAFVTDMGLGNPDVPEPHGDCTEAQTSCIDAPVGQDYDGHEVPEELLALVTFYSRHLAVPARRDVEDPEVLRGKELFYQTGCVGCHHPKYVTRDDDEVPVALRRQLIWPYTDMLLHDMGDGLADRRPQGAASGREWRTPPLWGIGLTQAVSGHTLFLHDGRARSLLEAVLWHGGEAEATRDSVAAMTPDNRAALIRFLESL
ncbi:di-heme oxidoredictase family protein [Lutibaculum baratangense]|uniref:Putative thiol oxidoreductase with 2 cytochrome c heme-binding sites n=1 Tax=Lutibaculum baratangense AMV1 TaxID=631454 RepID=V4QRP2_9HYPH|nr:di-heme oxidoredictase family protein [Lutibaculum baratangense]ESR22402.1 putative thiol oxidoreductase with 2 cytochrome c heme-binding sites [Lutibaculum baratangense AMV1]